jgi:hypothetical protein
LIDDPAGHLMGGGGVGGPHWVQGGYFSRLRARRQTLAATEAELRARGLPVPTVPMLPEKIIAIGLLCLLLLALFFGLIFR